MLQAPRSPGLSQFHFLSAEYCASFSPGTFKLIHFWSWRGHLSASKLLIFGSSAGRFGPGIERVFPKLTIPPEGLWVMGACT